MRLFGTSGIRRLADRELVQLSLQVGLAVGTLYKRVIVGRDTRTSGSALRHAVLAGLQAAGAMAADAGVLPTPTLALASREFAAGIMITASHNPPQYNGLKLLNPDGSAFSPAQQQQIEDWLAAEKSPEIQWDLMREGHSYPEAVEKHIARILQSFPDRRKIKVAVDCGCGAAYFITPEMLRRSGCEVVCLNCTASGLFPHDVEPVEANLEDLKQAVKTSGAKVGIAHDGDADRVMAVDERGRFISGDKLLAILAGSSLSSEIVTTIDASMCLEEMGFKVRRTPVGDPFVSEELKKYGDFGGEPSGAWVFPQISLCPDGIFGAARIVDIARSHQLSELADSIPTYPVRRGNVNGRVRSLPELHDQLISGLKPLKVETIDGIKLIFSEGWLLVRPSGTEPKIRVSCEARDEITAGHLYDQASDLVKCCIREG
jgi:phosphoglucosamine mutase